MKGSNARQLRTEFLDKGWATSSINRLLKKFIDTGTVDRSNQLHHFSEPLTFSQSKQICLQKACSFVYNSFVAIKELRKSVKISLS